MRNIDPVRFGKVFFLVAILVMCILDPSANALLLFANISFLYTCDTKWFKRLTKFEVRHPSIPWVSAWTLMAAFDLYMTLSKRAYGVLSIILTIMVTAMALLGWITISVLHRRELRSG